MYNTLVRMWRKGSLSPVQVDNAVKKGWISSEQAETIKAMPRR